jgi:tetratricopeptide (TPR) repeat protein
MAELALARDWHERTAQRDQVAGRALQALLQEVRAEVALAEGDLHTTRTNLKQARDTFRDLERPADAIRCLNDLGRIELDDGESQRAVDTFRAAVSLASTAGLRKEQRRARVGLGEALVYVGTVDEAAAILRTVLRESRSGQEDRRTLSSASVAMARVMLARGLARDAERYVELSLSHRPAGPTAARAHLVRADALLSVGQIRQARRALREAASLAERSGQAALRKHAEERLEVLEPASGGPVREERLATEGHR